MNFGLDRWGPRAAWAGSAYNLGNAALLAGALLGLSEGGQASFSAPLALAAAITLFIAGLCYARERYERGNLVSAFGAALLGVHLVLSGMVVAGVLVLLAHAVPKLLGAFPDQSRGFVKYPEKIAGFGPMVTRVPVMIDSYLAGDALMFAAAALWLFADFCLTRPLFEKQVSA